MASAPAGRLSWVDLPLPLALLVLGLVGTGPAAQNTGMPAPPLAYVLVVVAALGLLLWRLRPLWNLVVTVSAALLYLLLGYTYGPIMLTLAVAAFGAALWLPLRRAVAATGTVVVAALVVEAVATVANGRPWSDFAVAAGLAIPAWLGIPAAVGVAIRVRRDAAAEVRSAQARRAVSEERLRLAQEVHDVAGHGFAVIAMQAGVALRVIDRDPAAARAALVAIRDASRDALAGLRAEVEALRTGLASGDRGETGEGPRRPQPGLADLPALVGRMRSAGLPVTLDGPPSGLDVSPAVDLAAHRIVQEALTNVLRHAGPRASAWVTVRVAGDRLHIEVRDNGLGDSIDRDGQAAASGHGLAGMRVRAASVGGVLTAGPLDPAGFLVTVSLPLSGEDGVT
ncbi:MAG: sensor histidine kinase [Micromonosporaceae bacterium]|nr:sensor histidine kinase [Micromonosporaceae bacterium]